jgi:hydrogenase maturation protein HypF
MQRIDTAMSALPQIKADALVAERIRVRGTVQGVGFRPTVWRIATELGIAGSVVNDTQGVLVTAVAPAAALDRLVRRLLSEAPPLARITSVERIPIDVPPSPSAAFEIGASVAGKPLTAIAAVTADAATCAACVAEIFDPFARRFRYPLTNCTHCGPRLSFVTGVPYDRAATTMAAYPMCDACRAEYDAPADRRFHAQPIACHACGPKVRLKRLDGRAFTIDSYSFLDDCDAAGTLLARGEVIAIKGLGGYQLACDATQASAVAHLRALKRRERKPFALMAASVEAVRAWCAVNDEEAALLQSSAAPIVLLQRRPPAAATAIADEAAPGVATLGFMLPSTGIHHLVLRRMKRPIVLTSGNLSDEPQAITLDELSQRFAGGIDFVLDHDRTIARRVDDSVARVVDGTPQLLRRARGHAPRPIPMPPGFEAAPPVLAYGGELKNTFCLLRDGQAVLSPHIGDLQDAATQTDYHRAIGDLQRFFVFQPERHACDRHPDYASTYLAHADAARTGAQTMAVLHHHAHVAACLVDNGWPPDAGPVIGVALDGLGLGDGGQWWGGEFAIADYRRFDRRGTFKPVALLGGDHAAREPWRNTYAHLMAEMKWPAFTMNYHELALHDFLAAQPRELLDGMLARQVNAPPASSCGRLFDAVAAAVGICREHAAYEGQGAVELEACVDADVLRDESDELAYPFAIPRLKGSGLRYVEPLAMWSALLGDLVLDTPVPTISARFHKGLATVIVKMADQIAQAESAGGKRALRHVALSGGVFQNRVLFERVGNGLRAAGYTVLSHRDIPCNDGGLSLGQAAVAAARSLYPPSEPSSCA